MYIIGGIVKRNWNLLYGLYLIRFQFGIESKIVQPLRRTRENVFSSLL